MGEVGTVAGTIPASNWRDHFMDNANRKVSDVEQRHPARQRAMSIAEFCGRYGPGRTTAYEEIKSGRLRGRKIGKRTIITEDDAEEWLRNLPLIEAAR